MATEATDATGGGLVFHPMDQFIIKPMFGDGDIGLFTITNSAFWMILAIIVIVALMVVGTRSRAIVPTRSQSVAELAYGFV